MTSILLTRAKRAAGQQPFFEIVSGGFQRNFRVDYTFQFEYRYMAISYYFLKDIIFAAIMIFMFRLVNEDYREKFTGPISYIATVIDPESGEEVTKITESSSSYDFTNYTPVK